MRPAVVAIVLFAAQAMATAVSGNSFAKRQAPQVQILPGCDSACNEYTKEVTDCNRVQTCLCDTKIQRGLVRCLQCDIQVQGPTDQPANIQSAQQVVNTFVSACQSAASVSLEVSTITSYSDFSTVSIVSGSSVPPATMTPAATGPSPATSAVGGAASATSTSNAALGLRSGPMWVAAGVIPLLLAL